MRVEAPARIGELLLAAGFVRAEQVEVAVTAQRKSGRRLGEELVRLGFVSEVQLTQMLSNQLSVPWVSLYHVEFSRELLNLIPARLAQRYVVIPVYKRRVRRRGETLFVAMHDPTNDDVLHAISDAARLPVKAMVAPPSEIRNAIRVYYFAGATPPPFSLPRLRDSVSALPAERTQTDLQREATDPEIRREPTRPDAINPKPGDVDQTGETDAIVIADAEDESLEALPPLAGSQTERKLHNNVEPTGEHDAQLTSELDELADELDDALAAEKKGRFDREVITNVTAPAPSATSETLPSLRTLAKEAAEHEAKLDIAPVAHLDRGDLDADVDEAANEAESTAVEDREIDVTLPRPTRMRTITLLDGTKVRLPTSSTEVPAAEQLTAADLIAALMARHQGQDVSEILRDASFDSLFATLLTLLIRKGVIADWEFVEEWKKRRRETPKSGPENE